MSLQSEDYLKSLLLREDRESSLPKWAQEQLAAIRRAFVDARSELLEIKAGSEIGPFYFRKNMKTYLRLNRFFGLEFEHGTTHLRLHQSGEWLEIAGIATKHLHIEVRPIAANVVIVRSDKDS